jgi:uncharacterized protein involved in outer membrane biogenesis
VREALTVIGFLLILGFAAVFAAPLYVDWNAWRDTIAARLASRLGTVVKIEGPIEARLLPQPWLSARALTIGDPYGSTRLTIEGVEGDISLAALLRGDIELTNVVLDSPSLSVTSGEDGRVEPLSQRPVSGEAEIDSFEVRNGSLHYIDRQAGHDITLDGLSLIGEARSLAGPFKAEGGMQIGGVPHTIKIATGGSPAGGVRLTASIVPADRPITLELDGLAELVDGRPVFDGNATLARPPVNIRGDKGPPEEPWTIAARMKLTSSSLLAEALSIQIGPDERALKFAGAASVLLGRQARIDAMLTATQLELDRLAGVTPDRKTPPFAVLSHLREALPDLSPRGIAAQIAVKADAVMLGSQLMQGVKADLLSSGQDWRISDFEADLPGQSRLVLSGDVASEEGRGVFSGNVVIDSKRASTLISWLQGDDRPSPPNAARSLRLEAGVKAAQDAVSLSKLRLAIDEATVEGDLAWTRLSPDSPAGRLEANLVAQRLDLDALPAAAALMPGGSPTFAEADIKLSAKSIAFAGIEAKSANGRVKAGGKLIALEDVTIDDLGGTTLAANGRIDIIGAVPKGEIRVTIGGRDLSGLATALRRSPLPAPLIDTFSSRARALSPASADIVVSFGDAQRLTLDGKMGGTVAQFALELSGEGARREVEMSLRADSLDAAAMLRQMGLETAAVKIPGRATAQLALAGPLEGPRRWQASLAAAGLDLRGSGRAMGRIGADGLEPQTIDGHIGARTSDVLTPAQLFGLALPAAMPGEGAELAIDFRSKGGRLDLDRLTGEVLGMAMTGALAIGPGKPARVSGKLHFTTLDAVRLASLIAGSDLSAAAAQNSAWPSDPFGVGAFDHIAGSVDISADTLEISQRLPTATGAKATLVFEPAAASLDDFSARLAGGTLGASLRFSRSAIETALTGRVTLSDIAVATRELSGRLDAAVDLQGTGRTPASLVASLTGGGAVALRDPRLDRLSEAAFGTLVAAVDRGMPAQIAKVRPLFEQSLSEAALVTGDVGGSLSLAGGVLHLATATTKANTTRVSMAGSIDLATLTVKADILLVPPAPGDGFGGPPPAIQVSSLGALEALRREVDVASLTAWLTVRAAEREAKKLEQLEAERAAREKALEEQRRAEAARRQQELEARRAAEEAAARAKAAEEDAAELARRKAAEEAIRRRAGTGGAPPSPSPTVPLSPTQPADASRPARPTSPSPPPLEPLPRSEPLSMPSDAAPWDMPPIPVSRPPVTRRARAEPPLRPATPKPVVPPSVGEGFLIGLKALFAP